MTPSHKSMSLILKIIWRCWKERELISNRKQQPYSLWGHRLLVERGKADLNPRSATKNRKEETFEAKEGLRISVSKELERHGQEAMLKWQFCAAFFFFSPLRSFHNHPVKKIAFKDFPSTQMRALTVSLSAAAQGSGAPPRFQAALGFGVLPPATDHFNLFKAEQPTLHRPRSTESPQ